LWERLIAVKMGNLSQQVSGKDAVMNILNRLGLPYLRSIRRAVRTVRIVLVAAALTLPSMTARSAIAPLIEDSRPGAVLVLSEEASRSTIEKNQQGDNAYSSTQLPMKNLLPKRSRSISKR